MKKGFTLIELLAVIVILAIIALIATPIVLNIINDAKESAVLRSAEFYMEGVEHSIATSILKNKTVKDGTHYILKDGNICLENPKNDICPQEKTLEVSIKGEKPDSGTITITNGNITGLNIILEEREITKNSKGELVYLKTLKDVCKYVNNGVQEKTAGAKYECKVDPNKASYTFYVLTTPKSYDKSIYLIMAQNINSDGTPTTKAISEADKDDNKGIYNLVSWISKDDYGTLYPYDEDMCWDEDGCILNNKGPITAMKFLQEATKNWTNANEFKTSNMYAEMPSYYEDGDLDVNAEYLYDNLGDGEGYWTDSAYSYEGAHCFEYYTSGYIANTNVDALYGVRPVIYLRI